MAEEKKGLFDNVWTIPNALTVLRILLVPVFVLCFYKGKIIPAFLIVVFSGVTDNLDGRIARKFNQISELGKTLDPVADKLTQITLAVMFYLEFKKSASPSMAAFSWVFLLFLFKELFMIFVGFIMLIIGLRPVPAVIYGKVATVVFYIVMATLLSFGPDIGAFSKMFPVVTIPEWFAMMLVVIATILTFIALFSYFPVTIRQFKEKFGKNKNKDKGQKI